MGQPTSQVKFLSLAFKVHIHSSEFDKLNERTIVRMFLRNKPF